LNAEFRGYVPPPARSGCAPAPPELLGRGPRSAFRSLQDCQADQLLAARDTATATTASVPPRGHFLFVKTDLVLSPLPTPTHRLRLLTSAMLSPPGPFRTACSSALACRFFLLLVNPPLSVPVAGSTRSRRFLLSSPPGLRSVLSPISPPLHSSRASVPNRRLNPSPASGSSRPASRPRLSWRLIAAPSSGGPRQLLGCGDGRRGLSAWSLGRLERRV